MLPKKLKKYESNGIELYQYVTGQGEYSEPLINIQFNIYKKISELNSELTFVQIEKIYNKKLMQSVERSWFIDKRRYRITLTILEKDLFPLSLNKNKIVLVS